MILDRKHALDDQIIHLTEDNMKSLQQEVSDVRGALLEKFPDQEFKRILPKLNPDQIIPKDALFQIELGPNPDSNIYGAYGWTIRADCVPYSFLLAKWIGIQVDVETPFIEELLLWIRKMNSQEDVPCRNSQWRHEYFQKRRLMLKKKLKKLLQKEIMDLILISEHFRNGTLVQETGFFSFYTALFQRKLLNDVDCQP